MAWHRKLIARKYDGRKRRGPGRPRVLDEIQQLVVRMAKENRDWGYRRIQGALANLGHQVSRNTIANILKEQGLEPAPERERKTTWNEFLMSRSVRLIVWSAKDQLVDEMRISFTHSRRMDWFVPGLAPTNKPVEIDLVVIVSFATARSPVSGSIETRPPYCGSLVCWTPRPGRLQLVYTLSKILQRR